MPRKKREGSDPNQTGRNIHLLKIKAIYSKVGSIEDPFTKINSARLLASRLLQSRSHCRVTSLESKYEVKRKIIKKKRNSTLMFSMVGWIKILWSNLDSSTTQGISPIQFPSEFKTLKIFNFSALAIHTTRAGRWEERRGSSWFMGITHSFWPENEMWIQFSGALGTKLGSYPDGKIKRRIIVPYHLQLMAVQAYSPLIIPIRRWASASSSRENKIQFHGLFTGVLSMVSDIKRKGRTAFCKCAINCRAEMISLSINEINTRSNLCCFYPAFKFH